MNSTDLKLPAILPAIRGYVIKKLNENEERSLYNNAGRLYRLEKNMELIAKEEQVSENIQSHLFLLLYTDLLNQATSKLERFDIDLTVKQAQKRANKLRNKFEFSDKILNRLLKGLKESMPGYVAVLPEAQIMHDVIMMDFSGSKGREHLKLLYEEMLLRDIELPKENWYDALINLIDGRQAYTIYGKQHIQPEIDKLVKKLRKEKKDIEYKKSLLLKKELNINEAEIKKLRKDINRAASRDDKGIQTLFRTTIKNHYTLNEMVDRKANIMITVNSIILSMLMGGVFTYDENFSITSIPTILLSITCISSIVFAIISIIPAKTQGDFSEEEIRSKEGNLLYFGNFHNMHLRDFEWGFLQLLNDKEYLYQSMIRDYYFQGIGLNRKYKFIRISLTIFLIGFGISFIFFLLTPLVSMK